MFKVTENWIRQHGTVGSGFTDRQIFILTGRDPYKGWLQDSIGRMITDHQKSEFEQRRKKTYVPEGQQSMF